VTGRSPAGRARRGDGGSATVYVLALTALLWLAGLVVLLFAQVADARARAATAADLAALAGASHVLTGEACHAAAAVTRAQSAELNTCTVDGWDVRVLVSVRLKGPLARFPPAQARARAGPASSAATH
jgi:secretion/DNA translocation related TadE-like protein